MSSLDAGIPEHLPGEPTPIDYSLGFLVKEFTFKFVGLWLALAVALPLWPVYLLLRLGLARPPHLPSPGRFAWMMSKVMVGKPPEPGLTVRGRLAMALILSRNLALTPVFGLAWYLDELLYGRELRQISIVEPLFEISAARSGSTQLAHYLEDDPHLVAPTAIQVTYPYLWLWKWAPRIFGSWVSRDWIQKFVSDSVPLEYLQRHELDPFRTDTFEIIYFLGQWGSVFLGLGPEVMKEYLAPDRLDEHNRDYWEKDFVSFIDGIGRKTLLYVQHSAQAHPRRLMIKGHFLVVAPALERRYPDARFLTMVRAPDKRLQSFINFLRCNPYDHLVGRVPWPWLVAGVMDMEITYCLDEMAFFQKEGGARRCVVRFDDYVKDLEGTMKLVYRECLDCDEVPPHVPRVHGDRVRTNYSVDRSLLQLRVNVDQLNQDLADYRVWCRGRGPRMDSAVARETPPG